MQKYSDQVIPVSSIPAVGSKRSAPGNYEGSLAKVSRASGDTSVPSLLKVSTPPMRPVSSTLSSPASQASEASASWPTSVGKRPPRDMKRLDKDVWYKVTRTAKWGDTPALFLQADVSADDTTVKVPSGFFKPPQKYFTFNFKCGDKVQITEVGYSHSRNKIATAIAIKPCEQSEEKPTPMKTEQNNQDSKHTISYLNKQFVPSQPQLPAAGYNATLPLLMQRLIDANKNQMLSQIATIGLMQQQASSVCHQQLLPSQLPLSNPALLRLNGSLQLNKGNMQCFGGAPSMNSVFPSNISNPLLPQLPLYSASKSSIPGQSSLLQNYLTSLQQPHM